MKQKILLGLISTGVLLVVSSIFYVVIPKPKKSNLLLGAKKIVIQDVILPKEDVVAMFMPQLYEDVDVYNQLLKQGVKMKIHDELVAGIHKEVKKKLKEKGIKSYRVKVKKRDGTIKATKIKMVK